MNNKEEENNKPIPPPLSAYFDALWPRMREVMGFVGGFGIMVFEALGDASDRPWLYAAAIGMMGLPIARVAENTLGRLSGSTPSSEEPPRPRQRSRENFHDEG